MYVYVDVIEFGFGLLVANACITKLQGKISLVEVPIHSQSHFIRYNCFNAHLCKNQPITWQLHSAFKDIDMVGITC